MPKEAVWNDVVAWIDAHPMSAGKVLDWDSNKILADLTYPLTSGHAAADCGFNNSQPVLENRGQMAISIMSVAPNETTVTIHSTFREYRHDDLSGNTVMAECTSNGSLETSLFEAIS